MPTTKYRHEREIVDFFVDLLEQRLAGRHKERIVNRVPVDECHLGVLGPYRQEVDEVDPTETGEATGDEPTAASGTDEAGVRSPGNMPGTASKGEDQETDAGDTAPKEGREERDFVRRPPSSLGIEFLLESVAGEVALEIDVGFAIYTPHLPTFDEQRLSLGVAGEVNATDGRMTLAEVWQRRNITVSGIRVFIPTDHARNLDDNGKIQTELDQVVEAALAESDGMPLFETQPKVDVAVLTDKGLFRGWLEEVRKGLERRRPLLRAALEVRSQPYGDGRFRLSVYLRNNTLRRPTRMEDNYLILADAKVRVRILTGTLKPVEILPVPEDYQYDRMVWAVGHSASVEVDDQLRILETRTLARFRQPRLTTQNEPPARFEDLNERPFDVLEAIRRAMEDYADKWKVETIERNDLGLDEASLVECRKDLAGFRGEIDRFCCGIAALRIDPRLLTAFQGMNRVMGRVAKDYESWRLFQIVFIVSLLPAITLREGRAVGEWPEGVKRNWQDELDWADVLWFPTGGGKTEAYLGLVSCTVLYDRLRGKKFGLTAWLRFPLRMLSVQQLQRATLMIWETERERKALMGPEAEGADSVCLGYFVGGTTTPNQLDDKFFQDHPDVSSCERYRVVADCPACQKDGTVLVVPDRQKYRLRHVCGACNAELPLFITDSEIYRFLPALLVGTVDKMATVGLQSRFGILWAGPRWICPEHGYSYGKYCAVFECKVSKDKKAYRKVEPYDPSPTFHVQDELHLLQEELGAFAGHYETLTRYCEETAGRSPAKVIAATATIEGYEHQVRHLYGVKGARRFPGRGFKRHESFYVTLESDPETPEVPKTARIFLAFRPPSGNTADVAGKCTQILHEAIAGMIQNPYDGLAALPSLETINELHDLRHFYSATLTYVNSLQSGTRVKDLLRSTAQDVHKGLRELNVEYLSSRSSTGEVSTVIHRMEEPPSWEDKEYLDAVVATNMISHGVDLDRINLMVMDKFPAEAAQYIQASSRSGRKKVGLVTVVLPAYNLRAASIYHRFREYHQHLDRMVSPVPVNRFAKYAVCRTLPGMLSGLLFGLVGPQENDLGFANRHAALAWIKKDPMMVIELLRSAYAIGRGVYEHDLEEFYSQAIGDRFNELLGVLMASHEKKLTGAMRPKPMTSLRDVDRGIPFRMRSTDPMFHYWFRKDME